MDQEYTLDEQELERRRLMRKEMKRKALIRQRIAIGAALALIVLILILIINSCSKRKAERAAEQAHQEALDALPEDEVISAKATLAAFGDVMCYNDQIYDAQTASGKYDFSPSFELISPYLSADLTVGNLELNFCGDPTTYSGDRNNFRAPESLATALADAGVDILQTANTCSIMNSISGLESTIHYVSEAGITPLGTYATSADKRRDEGVQFRDVNGIRFAFFAYTKGMSNSNSLPVEGDYDYAVDVLFEDYNSNFENVNKAGLLRSIKAAKAGEADVIVAMLHWGSEYKEPDQKQEEIAQFLFENGVDVILGTHSHLVGPMEKRTVVADGREKEVFIAYSLGNFFSSMQTQDDETKKSTRNSVILNLEFSKNAETGVVSISDVSYLPIYFWDKGKGADTRFLVLPIRKAMDSGEFSDLDDTFTEAIAALKSQTKSDFDSGN